jgi:hypothetical protein
MEFFSSLKTRTLKLAQTNGRSRAISVHLGPVYLTASMNNWNADECCRLG